MACPGSGRSNLAAVNSGGALLGWNPGTNGDVHELVEAADLATVYLAGGFSTVAGAGRDNIAEITNGGSATSFDPDANNIVYGLALTGRDAELVVAGAFTSVGGSSRNRLAEIRTSNGTATSWDPDANGDGWTVALGSGTIFAGGAFGSINGVARANLAALDVASGELDMAWQADTNDEVLALDVLFNGINLYIGGRFSTVGGVSRNRIAAVKTKTSIVVGAFKPHASGNVFAIHATQNHVYVGGEFTSIASTRRGRIASLDPVFGSLDFGFSADVSARVRSITTSPDGDVVYIGGDFATVDGVARANLAALQAATGDLVLSFNGVTGRRVYNMATDADRLYAAMGGSGGRFSAMDLGTGAEDYAISIDGDAQAVTLMGDYAYVGGHFDKTDGQSRVRLMAVERATGILSNDWTPTTDGNLSVFAMADYAGSIWMVGDFHVVKSRTTQHVAKIGGILENDGLYSSTVKLDGADAYWRLGETVGSSAFEEIGNEDGTYGGSPALGTTGLITDSDTAVTLGGGADVTLPDDSAINTGGPYTDRTFELWFNADAVATRQVLIETGGTTRGYVIYVEGGSVHGGAWNTTNNGADTPWGPVWTLTPISAGTTYHVVLIHDVGGDSLRLYLNGTEKDDQPGVGTIFAHGRDGAIGAMIDQSRFPTGSETGDGFRFSGVIDEVAIYGTQLSAGDIANHRAIGTTNLRLTQTGLGHEETRLDSNPISYWSMGDPDTGVVVDSIGGMHGVDQTGLQTVSGRVGTGDASRFDGVGDAVLLPDDPLANVGAPVVARSIETVFVSRSNAVGVLYEEGGGRRGLNMFTSRGYLHVGAWDVSQSAIGSGNDFIAFASARIERGRLVNAVMVFDAAAGTLQLYLDGVLAAESSGVHEVGRHGADRAIGAMAQSTRLRARAKFGDGLNFNGMIDEIVMYATALSAETVREHATTTR